MSPNFESEVICTIHGLFAKVVCHKQVIHLGEKISTWARVACIELDFNMVVNFKFQERYGGHGYKYMAKYVKDRMIRKGFTDDNIQSIFFENPADVFPF